MTGRARCGAVRGCTRSGGSALATRRARCVPPEPRLDQLLAEPMVQQLMHRDRIDEATTRRLLLQAAVARSAPKPDFVQPASWAEGVFAVAVGALLLIGIRHAWDATVRTLLRRRD
jgi:plasmid replication initiation protein